MEQLSDKLLLMTYQKAIQLHKEGKRIGDFIETLEVEISRRGLPLKKR